MAGRNFIAASAAVVLVVLSLGGSARIQGATAAPVELLSQEGDAGTWAGSAAPSQSPLPFWDAETVSSFGGDSLASSHSDKSSQQTVQYTLTARPELSWRIEPVDTPRLFRDMGPRSLALDATGRPHIAYGSDHLYYAFYDGAQWHTEVVDSAPGVGQYASLAVDSAGYPHISYYDQINKDLMYARYDGVLWHLARLDSAGDVGQSTSIALDAEDRAHIVYHDSPSHLKYAHYDGTGWQLEHVAHAYARGYNSLALDAAGRPHIAYRGPGTLNHAWHDGASWHIETVDTFRDFRGISLALDAIGYPHISYYGTLDSYLRYAYYDGNAWRVELINHYVGQYTSLVMDEGGQPNISYHDPRSMCLSYVHYNGTSWLSTVVDGAGGLYSSLVIDTQGRPRISYYSDGAVKYAAYDGVSWQRETVDRGGDVGQCASVALDSTGQAHVSYYDAANDDLKYAHQVGTTWYVETVDAYGGMSTSLALDAADRPHIAYLDRSSVIKYAHYDGTAWQIEAIAGGDAIGNLALDSGGLPHLSYSAGRCWFETPWPPPYYHYCYYSLYHTWFDGASWQTEVWAEAPGSADSRPEGRVQLPIVPPHVIYTIYDGSTLAMDPSDQVHIAFRYYHLDSQCCESSDLEYDHETADSTSTDVSVTNSLALDAAGRPHIGYSSDGMLRYAYRDGTFWYSQTVDGPGVTAVSLAMDATGRPHLAYQRGELTYALYDGRYWYIEALDSTGQMAASGSLAVGASGEAHVVYYDPINGDLMHASSGTCVPVASVTLQGPTSLPSGIAGSYTASCAPVNSTTPLILRWNNGAIDPTAVYSWTVTGTHSVTASVSNPCSQVTTSLPVTVFCQPPVGVAIGGPRTLVPDLLGTYWADVQPITASRPLTFTWDNGATGPRATYSWPTTGTYTITAVADNSCGQASGQYTVRVLAEWPWHFYLPLVLDAYAPPPCTPPQDASFTWEPLSPTVGTAVQFDASASGSSPLYFRWAFGDGGSGFGKSATHTYALSGTYTVTLTASNNCGTYVATATLAVSCAPVHDATFSWVPLTPTAGLPITFTAAASGTLPVTFTWDFGDGGSGFGESATHTYALSGTYTVTLTASNSCGSDVASATLSVTCSPVHDTSFSWAPLTPTAGLPITFTAAASGTLPVTFTWGFGDGGSGSAASATHTYALTGTYTVTLTTSNACGQEAVSAVVVVGDRAAVWSAAQEWRQLSQVRNY